ncbi:hypothetical protein MTO96_007295 [Rhipicephalus appendiculatus]
MAGAEEDLSDEMETNHDMNEEDAMSDDSACSEDDKGRRCRRRETNRGVASKDHGESLPVRQPHSSDRLLA